MNDTIKSYINDLNKCYATGVAREHAYRPALQNMMIGLLPKNYTVVNEPARTECGAPDFIILKGDTPLAFIEAKDLQDTDLDGKKEHKEQFERYRASLDHIIFTDYLDFHLYENGEFVDAVRLADIRGEKIVLNQESVNKFLELINRLANATPQRITSPTRLAKMMASKARLLANVIETALKDDDNSSELAHQMKTFQDLLIHDLNEKTFADIYAQTIAYGLFTARLNDKTPDDFSRMEANMLIPDSNPFLRRIFNEIAGFNIDSRISWIVDDLVEAFRVTDMARVMKDFKQSTQQTDPLMHFYEDFLGQYDPALKKSRGVFYTPQPVVDFIVRAVDDILKRDFALSMGLADNSMIEHEVINDQFMRGVKGATKKIHKRMHRVQILDPATGTGTFLASIIRKIYDNMEGQRGAWSNYVDEHLLPRLNGFELMMASYTIAHLKLNMVLNETGYVPQSKQRLRVYLTNSLEEFSADTGTLFSAAISNESHEASYIKRDCPVMVMIGNPPYSVSSTNNSNYINRLIDSYKRNLKERNIQPLSDDYIKFIRLGQEYIIKNGEGILAFICNNSFLDGIIHRQMRKELMLTFDKIYILDLHGNSRKNEMTPNGSKDENVFDIMQGVSINIFYRSSNRKHNGCLLFHHDLYGDRESKYNFLNSHKLDEVLWTELLPEEPYNFFVPKNFSLKDEYDKGFKINELMGVNVSGIKTHRDDASIFITEDEMKSMYSSFLTLSVEEIKHKYGFKDVRDWKVAYAKADLQRNSILTSKILYRPFDIRWTLYTGQTKGIQGYPRLDKMCHLINKENYSLIVCKQQSTFDFQHVFVTSIVSDMCSVSSQTKETGYIFPLYLYSEDNAIKKPNFNTEIVQQIEATLGETVVSLELFDYIYAVLHSSTYRAKYKELLKIDFPCIPYPESKEEYHRLAELGGKLRRLHLMLDVPPLQYAKFDKQGSNNVIEKIEYKDGCVWINKEKCFSDVPEIAWNFYIGGYQPAQKWLKDRKGRELSYDDITHYRKIISILLETDRLMIIIDTQ